MATEIRVPTLGESISEATVGKWFKQRGDVVKADEPLVELETDKVTLEVNAPTAGVLTEIVAETGQTVAIGALLGGLSAAGAAPAQAPAGLAPEGPAPKPAAAPTAMPPAPSAAKIASESALDLAAVAGTGKRGQVLKGDALEALAKAAVKPAAPVVALAPRA
jgi:2-oxoglutarate dehydrogenase E2 component (dihydrolipoamide succinyltransferase)